MKDRNDVEIAMGDRVLVCISSTPSTIVEGVVTYVKPTKVNYRVVSTTDAVYTAPKLSEVLEVRVSHRVRILP